MGAKVANLG